MGRGLYAIVLFLIALGILGSAAHPPAAALSWPLWMSTFTPDERVVLQFESYKASALRFELYSVPPARALSELTRARGELLPLLPGKLVRRGSQPVEQSRLTAEFKENDEIFSRRE